MMSHFPIRVVLPRNHKLVGALSKAMSMIQSVALSSNGKLYSLEPRHNYKFDGNRLLPG